MTSTTRTEENESNLTKTGQTVADFANNVLGTVMRHAGKAALLVYTGLSLTASGLHNEEDRRLEAQRKFDLTQASKYDVSVFPADHPIASVIAEPVRGINNDLMNGMLVVGGGLPFVGDQVEDTLQGLRNNAGNSSAAVLTLVLGATGVAAGAGAGIRAIRRRKEKGATIG